VADTAIMPMAGHRCVATATMITRLTLARRTVTGDLITSRMACSSEWDPGTAGASGEASMGVVFMGEVTTVAAATDAGIMDAADMAATDVEDMAGAALTTDAVPMAADTVDAETLAVADAGLVAAGAAGTSNRMVVAASTVVVAADSTAAAVVDSTVVAVVASTAVADMVVEGTAKTLRS
jgi:hypothetical protein